MPEIKRLKNNTGADYYINDMAVTVPANGTLDLSQAQWVSLASSADMESGCTDNAFGVGLHSLTFIDGSTFDQRNLAIADEVHPAIGMYTAQVNTTPEYKNRASMRTFDRRRQENMQFGASGFSTANTSFTTVAKFMRQGTLLLPPPKRIVVIASQSVSAASISIVDLSNGNAVLASATNFTAASADMIELTVSDASVWSKNDCMIELQVKTGGGVLPQVTAYALTLVG